MSRHEGVSCDSCMKSNFPNLRYKCLICYDYDLCAACYNVGAVSSRHASEHAMQCILTRADYNMYYGGDSAGVTQPQSYTCSYCGRMGFTVVLLQEHIRAMHSDVTATEVVCPVCAAHPGGDPNHVTDDLATHLALVHRQTATEFDDDQLSGIRQIRRLTHPARMSNIGSRPNRTPVMQLLEPPTSGLSPTARDPMDPIAELLSQLSSVRSRAAVAQGMTSHLQQLEMQLASTKQQLERLPMRNAVESSKASSSATPGRGPADPQPVNGKPSTTVTSSGGTLTTTSSSSSRSQFLLARTSESHLSEMERFKTETDNADRSLFLQELLISTLVGDFDVNTAELSWTDLSSQSPSGATVDSERPLVTRTIDDECCVNGGPGYSMPPSMEDMTMEEEEMAKENLDVVGHGINCSESNERLKESHSL